MPELPEVETVCQSLKKIAINQQIQTIIIRQYSLRWPINPKLEKILANITIKNIYRRAKYILIDCYIGCLIIHLGMSGKISILSKQSINYNIITKHDHYDIILNNNIIIRYNDPRRFGAMLWTEDDPSRHNLLINLGIEPFDPKFNAKYLFNKAKKTLSPVKQFIMNNKIVVGVGNIYANEALFEACINPASLAKNINLNQLNYLVKAIKKILKIAIAQGGTTLKDFFDPNGTPGYFVQSLKVYGRTNQPCLTCRAHISQIKLGQRSTFFCEFCQPITA
jgi:formamidopyrimidine-DNA glycosylase